MTGEAPEGRIPDPSENTDEHRLRRLREGTIWRICPPPYEIEPSQRIADDLDPGEQGRTALGAMPPVEVSDSATVILRRDPFSLLDPGGGPRWADGLPRNWDGQTDEEFLALFQQNHDDGLVLVDVDRWVVYDDAIDEIGVDAVRRLRHEMERFLGLERRFVGLEREARQDPGDGA